MPPQELGPIEVLANPVRRYLVELLCVGEQTSGDLAIMCFDRFRIGWGAVTKHLKTLTASGITVAQRQGPVRFYLLDDDWLDRLEADVQELRRHWEAGADTRSLGYAHELHDEIVSRDPTRSRAGFRGKSEFTMADFGRGRSLESEWADAIADFE